MIDMHRKFKEDVEKKVFDLRHRQTIQFNMSRYDEAVIEGKKQFSNLDLAREKAASIKHKTINRLDKYLIDFDSNFTQRGGKVFWAQNKREAVKEIIRILTKSRSKKVVKSKSMITEEIELNEALLKSNIESIETDLGEYIVQLAEQPPYHIVTPAMHMSKEDIAKLFHEKFDISDESSPEEITLFVRKLLREKFINADAGITGANFLIADIGAVAITGNEGNAMLTFSMPRIHIVVAGIEKIIPSMEDLQLFWPLLASHGTGQSMTVYNSIVTGPRQDKESDGPEEMHVILIDNNRTEILKQEKQRRALSCIKCGACLNACPVYRNIGGHSYGTTYSGPIGAVITPFLKGMKNYKHLSFASTLCGKCTEVCPVNINLHELLLYNRNEAVKKKHITFNEKMVMTGWKNIMKRRWVLDMAGQRSKSLAMNMFFKKSWGPGRALPEVQPKSFKELWKEKNES